MNPHIMSSSQATTPASVPAWVQDAVFYQIFPDRFANADPALNPPDVRAWDSPPARDGFLGGDLAGIVAHLDHIVDLGANTLYLTPIFAAGTNHRYDAYDYFTIDPLLGDLGSFRELIREAHARGVRVVLDAVLNHCGVGHWAFQDVVANGAQSPYVNWFYVEDLPVVQRPVPNYGTCSGCWYLPKWNLHNPEVREHHLKVARYWLEQGIDGWRLDVPYFVPTAFWREFRRVVKEVNPEAYIVAEEWRSPTQWLAGDTADGTMNYTLRDLVLGFTADRKQDARTFAAGMNDLRDQVPHHARASMLNLLGSHDTERLVTRHEDDAVATRLALTLLTTSPGVPMVYYGDEIGMAGDNDPGCRAGMEWQKDRWDTETLQWLTSLLALRAKLPALRKGTDEYPYAVGDVVVRRRTLDDDVVLVAVNRGPVDVDVPRSAVGNVDLVEAWPVAGPSVPADAALRVPRRSAVVWTTGQRP
jgi:cyclomaltodextrinase